MKKIAIDITSLSDQYKNRGIGTYISNIVMHLIEFDDFEWHLLGYKDIANRFKKASFHSLGEVRMSTPLNLMYFRKEIIPIINKLEPDLYFAPNFEKGLPLRSCKTAVTIHDFSPLINNNFSQKGMIINFLKGLFYKYNFRKAKNADLIITISNFIKEELIRYGFNRNKIEVVYHGLTTDLQKNLKKADNRRMILDKYRINKPYLLYYGGLEPNKNVDKLILAFSKVINKRDLRLVIADKHLYRKDEDIVYDSKGAEKIFQLIRKLNISKKVILPKFIEGDDLPVVLAEAETFIHLSEYEGFGFAVLEAMSVGTPTIAADRSCYPEIFGKGALLVDPDDSDNIVESIIRIIDDKSLRKSLISNGKERIDKYTWEKAASKLVNSFKNAF